MPVFTEFSVVPPPCYDFNTLGEGLSNTPIPIASMERFFFWEGPVEVVESVIPFKISNVGTTLPTLFAHFNKGKEEAASMNSAKQVFSFIITHFESICKPNTNQNDAYQILFNLTNARRIHNTSIALSPIGVFATAKHLPSTPLFEALQIAISHNASNKKPINECLKKTPIKGVVLRIATNGPAQYTHVNKASGYRDKLLKYLNRCENKDVKSDYERDGGETWDWIKAISLIAVARLALHLIG